MSSTQNEILIKISADQEGSLPSLNKQIEQLSGKLDGLKLDIGIDKEAIKSLKQLANTDLKKISDEIAKINNQKLQVISESEARRAKEVMKNVFDVDFDKKKVFSSVEEIKRQLEGKGAQVKVDFTYDKDGREIINGITAISQKAGKTFSTKFKEVLVGEEKGWIPSSFTQIDKTMKNTEASIKHMTRALEDARSAGKITEQDFRRLGGSLDHFANVDKDLQAFNRELRQAKDNMANLTSEEAKHEKALHKIKQLQIDMIALGRQRPDAARRDEFVNLQRVLQAERERLEVMKQQGNFASNATSNTANLAQQLSRLRAETTEITRAQMGIFSAFQVAMERFPVWMGASTAFYGTIRTAKEFYNVVLDIDTKMTELKKVMADDTDFGAVFDRAVESADKFAQSVSGAMDSYIEFARQGFKGDELGFLADSGLVAANVADMTAQRASEYMTASLVQWKIDAEDSMSIIDKWNEISNNYATTTEKIAAGQARAGSTAKAMGLDFDQTNAIIGTLTATMKQSGSEIGNMLKFTLARLTSQPAQDALKALNVELTDAQGNIRNVMDVYTEVANRMKGLSEIEQSMITEGLAGKHHISRMQALLDDLGSVNSMYRQMYDTSVNSAGSAMEENEKYMQSLQARINQLRSEFEQLAVKVGESFLSEGVISFTKSLGRLLEVTAKVADTIGALPIVLTMVGGTILLVNNRFRLLFAQLATGKTTVGALAQSFVGASTAAGAAAVASRTFLTVLRGFGMATGIGLALTGVGMALEFITGKATAARESAEELKSEMKELTRDFARNEEEIKGLASSLSDMEKELARGSVPNNEMGEFTKDLIEKRNQLAELMPQLKKGEDEYGNAILYSNGIVESRIKLAERQLEIQRELEAAQKSQDEIEKLKSLQAEEEKLAKQLENRWAILEHIGKQTGRDKSGFGKSLIEDVDIKNLEDANAILERMQELKREAQADGNDRLVSDIQYRIDDFQNSLAEVAVMASEAEMVRLKLVEDSNNALMEVMEVNNAMEDSSKQLIGTMADLLNSSGLQTDEIRTISEALAESLQHDEKMQEYVSKYQNAISAMSKARDEFSQGKIPESAYLGKVRQVEEEAKKLIGHFKEISKNAKIDINTDSFKALDKELQVVGDSLENFFLQAGKMSDSQGIPMEQLIANLSMTGEQFDEAADSAENFSSVISAIGSDSADALTDILLETDRLVQSYQEAEVALQRYTAEEIANVEAKQERIAAMEAEGVVTEYLTVAEQLMLDEINNSNQAYQELLNTYGYLFTAEELSLMSKENIMKAIDAEIVSVDDLNIAIQALKDGKLGADDAMAVKGAQKAKQAIHNINAEIENLKLLVEAYEITAGASVKAAVAAGESAYKIGKALGTDSKEYKTAINAAYKLGNDAIVDTTALNNAKNSIKTYQGQVQELAGTVQQYSGAVKNVANRHREAYSTIGRGREFDTADAMRKANEALDKNTKGTKGNTGAKKGNTAAKQKNAKATKDGAKAEELAKFWVDKHKESVEELTLALKAQELATKKFPKHSQEYKKGLQEVLKLEKLKLELMKAQERSLKQQIDSGVIIKAGVQTQSQIDARNKGVGANKSGSKAYVAAGTRNLAGWNGVKTSGYGGRYDPFTKTWTGHQGVDIASPLGTKLESNIGGKVLFSGMGTGAWSSLGNYVAIQAVDGLVHYYGHLQKVAVKAGEQVVKGQQIGNIGSTGRSTGPHLHYGIRQNGQWINPTKKMNQSRGLQVIYGNNPSAYNSVNAPVVPVPRQVQVQQQPQARGGREAQIWNFFKGKGVTDQVAAAIMGNLQQESGLDPTKYQYGGPGRGLMQWEEGSNRFKNLVSFAKGRGKNWKDLESQLEFAWKEMMSDQYNRYVMNLKFGMKPEDFIKMTNTNKATEVFEKTYERAGTPMMAKRQSYAQNWYNKFKGTGGKGMANVRADGGYQSTGLVDKDTANNLKDVNDAYSELLKMQGDIIDQNERIRELEEQILNVYFDAINAKRQEHMQTIAYEEEKMKALDDTSLRYAKTLQIQVRNLEAKQGYNLEEMNYIDYLIKNTRMSADRLDELKVRYKELQTEILATNNELKDYNALLIDVDMRRFAESITRLSDEFNYLSTIRGTMEEGTGEYEKLTSKMIELAKQEAYQLQQQAVELQHLSSVRDLSIEKLKDYNKQIHELQTRYWQLTGTIQDLEKAQADFTKNAREKIANDLIEAYKQYLNEKRDMHMKSLEDERKREEELHKNRMDNLRKEMDEFQKAIDDRIKAIDDADSQMSYEDQIKEMGEERSKIAGDITLLTGDDSLEAKKRRKKLQEELDKIDKNIEKTKYDREKEMAKKHLNEMLEEKRDDISEREKLETERHDYVIEKIDREKEYWEKHYTDLLNDERKFALLREQLVAGHFEALSSEFGGFIKEMEDTMPSLEDTLDGTMQAVGTSIRQNVIDNLREALKMMEEFSTSQGGMGSGSSGGSDKPMQPSKPVTATEGDFWVLAGKFMADEVAQYAETEGRYNSIKDKGYSHASTGRDMGSTIEKNIAFEDAVANMSAEDQKRFADFIINNADDLVMTGEYQDMFRRMAWKILNKTAGFDTGGYTGKFKGGRLATLHEEELIMNKKDTSTFGNITEDLGKIQNIVKLLNPQSAAINQERTMSDIIVQMNVEKMVSHDESEAKNYAQIMSEQTLDAMKRKGWRR